MTIVNNKSGYKMVTYNGPSASLGLMLQKINYIESRKDILDRRDDYIIQLVYQKSFSKYTKGDFRITFDYKNYRSSDLYIMTRTSSRECDYNEEVFKIEDLTPKQIKALHSKVARAKKMVIDMMDKNTEAWQEHEASKLELTIDEWDKENRGFKTMLPHLDIQITK